MSTCVKGLLFTVSFYGGSVMLYLVWLVVALQIGGTGYGPRVGMAMTGAQAVGTATFLAGIALVYRTLRGLGVSRGVWIGGTLVYGLVACATLVILVLLTFVAFNR